jgi:hypothetical protein
MARPYPAGGVSIAESNNRCRRPAAVAACGLQAFSGPTFPRVPAAILIASDSNHTGLAKERRCGGEDRPEVLFSAFMMFSNQPLA